MAGRMQPMMVWQRVALTMMAAGGLVVCAASAECGEPPTGRTHAPSSKRLEPGGPQAHGLTANDLEALRAILRKSVANRVVPGVSLLLAHRGEVIFKEAFGDLTLGQQVQMASSAKPVTATLLMILVDQGKLALDDPLEKYLPEFKGSSLHGRPPIRPPTVRHVLSNMSGLPGDFLANSILKRARERAGKSKGSDARNGIGDDLKNTRAQF